MSIDVGRKAANTGLRVLVVEDEGLVAEELQDRLTRLNCEVVGLANTAEMAIEMARRSLPNVVLVDIRLKGKTDGIDAAEVLYREQNVPVVFLTAHSDRATMERAKAVAPFGYLLKPFRETELMVAMEIAVHRHQTEQDLKRTETTYAGVARYMADAVILADRNGRLCFLNSAAERLTGWRLEEARGLPVSQIARLVVQGTGEMAEIPLTAVPGENPQDRASERHCLINRAGLQIPVEELAAPVLDSDGQVTGTVVTLRDVTRRRSAEASLKASEERFRGAFDSAATGMAFVSPEGRWLRANQAFCDIVGYSKTELLERHFEAITHPSDLERDLGALVQMREGRTPVYRTEKRYIHKQGHTVWVQLVVSSVCDGSGCLLYFVSQVEDITGRQR